MDVQSSGYGAELVPELVRASVAVLDARYDGNVTNVADGSTVNGYDRQGARVRVDITPSRALKIGLIADHSRATDTTPTGVAYGTDVRSYPTNAVTSNPLWAAAVAPVTPSPTNRQINSEMQTRVNDRNQGLSAQLDYSLADLQLTSITAWRSWDNTQFQDQDRLASYSRNFVQTADRGDLAYTQWSQELRLASIGQRSLDYVAGLFWIHGKNDERYERVVTRCPSSTATADASGIVPCTSDTTQVDNGVALYGVRNTSRAAFGEATWHISPQLRAVSGLRYTQDDLSYYHGRTASATGVPGIQASRDTVRGSTTHSAWSGRIGPQYDLSPDALVHASYSRGYKGPAYNVFFNMTATQANVLAPETSESYELGLKSEWLARRLRVNVAAFQTEYDGYQANVPDLVNGSIVTRLINAGKVSTRGLELDVVARVTPAFTVNAGLAHVVARIKHFNCPVGAAASCDIDGKPLPFSPDWKATLRAQYSQPLSGGLSLDYGLDLRWQSRTGFDLQQQPDSVQGAYGIVDASIALRSGSWRLALVGKNLGDKSYASFVQSAGTNINRYVPRDDSRYFGLQFRYDI